MRKFLYAIFIGSLVFAATAFAAQTPEPEIDDPITPVDAPKAVITGTSEPGARIVVTGGSYDISPVTADSDGAFSVTVALGQESTNYFTVTAKDGDDEQSDAVTVVIVESAAEAAAYEASGGGDHTAPAAPELTYESINTNEIIYTITGTGEADADIFINDVDSKEDVDEDGNFEVEVDLTGNDTKDKFKVALKDAAGNLGSSTTVYVTSSAAPVAGDDDDDDDNDDDNNGSATFMDVAGHWGENYILQLYSKGVISGYGNGNFGPDDPVTRAQILKIALEAVGLDSGITNPNFSDVSGSAWYANYVQTGYSYGIIEGYSDDTFRPDNEVTRAAALKIILEAAGADVEGTDLSDNFSDVSENDWFAKYTAYAKNTGLVSGYGDGQFKGGQSITRAEVCKIVIQVIDAMID